MSKGVHIKDYVDQSVSGLRWKFAAAAIGFGVVIAVIDHKNGEARKLQNEGTREAAKIAMDAAERASAKADTAFEKRMDGVNEFRATLSDQQGTFITKANIRWAITAFFLAIGTMTAVYVAVSQS